MEPVTTDINMASLLLATAAVLVAILGSTVTTVILIFRQSNHFNKRLDRLDTKFDTKIDALDTKFDTKIDALDTKFDTKIDALDNKFTSEIRAVHGEFKIVRRDISVIGERLARVEGHLMGPETFSPSPLPPPTAEPDDGKRQAG